ncbi:MAG: lycopene cyclase family protein [Wenzhouxiangella sp.]
MSQVSHTRSPEHDLIIIGGGCAGLSLAGRLASQRSPLSAAVIETRSEYRDDRSWCFFAPARHRHDHLISHRWSRWLVGRENRALIERQSRQFSYQYIRSLDFYRTHLSAIEQHPLTELYRGTSVQAIERQGKHWRVETNQGCLTAAAVLDTRPPGRAQLEAATLLQSFKGVEIELEQDGMLETDCVELMTQLRHDHHGLYFTYLLPLGKRRALVEATRFSTERLPEAVLDQDLQALLNQRGLHGQRWLRQEAGCLPMGLPGKPHPVPGVVSAGMAGGALRPSSGYAFLRIQAWAARCLGRLQAGHPPIGQPADPRIQSRMDRLFLRVIAEDLSLAPDLFCQLFERGHPDSVIRFLGDQAGVGDYLNVVRSLPRRPFLRGLCLSPRRTWSVANSS